MHCTAEVPLHAHTHGVVRVGELEPRAVVVVEGLDGARHARVVLQTPVTSCIVTIIFYVFKISYYCHL